MTSSAKKVLEDALALPEDDRRRIAEHLLDSVPRESAEALQQAWNAEAAHRAGQLERGDVEALDGEASLRELEERLGARRAE